MKISKTLIHCLQQLAEGQSVPASMLRHDMAQALLAEGLLTVAAHGSRRSYRAVDAVALKNYVESHFEGLRPLENAGDLTRGDALSRSQQAAATGNSKLVSVRSCPGFPVNSYEPIACMLCGRELIVNPQEGSFLFIAEWQQFAIPSDVVVVGIENMENFRLVNRQRELFEKEMGHRHFLFVARYPQSADLRSWLLSIPNPYVHFGDFDLAGISIFLYEFQCHLGQRAQFFIPSDVEGRLQNGSQMRYNAQYHSFHHLHSDDSALQALINLIHRYRRCYDQEGYIPSPPK